MSSLLEGTWRLSGSVSLRPEPFGAMAYDFRSRRLSFLKSRDLVAVVEALDNGGEGGRVDDALTASGVDGDRRARFLRALEELAASGMLTRPDTQPVTEPASPDARTPSPAGAPA